eukprot:jgi/Botrbrau1/14802/Bobra.105_1s0014.1
MESAEPLSPLSFNFDALNCPVVGPQPGILTTGNETCTAVTPVGSHPMNVQPFHGGWTSSSNGFTSSASTVPPGLYTLSSRDPRKSGHPVASALQPARQLSNGNSPWSMPTMEGRSVVQEQERSPEPQTHDLSAGIRQNGNEPSPFRIRSASLDQTPPQAEGHNQGNGSLFGPQGGNPATLRAQGGYGGNLPWQNAAPHMDHFMRETQPIDLTSSKPSTKPAGKPPKPHSNLKTSRKATSSKSALASAKRPRRDIKPRRPWSPPPPDVPQLVNEEMRQEQKKKAQMRRRDIRRTGASQERHLAPALVPRKVYIPGNREDLQCTVGFSMDF